MEYILGPPLKILRTERGANDVEEYLNYVKELRILKDSFKVSRAADVDTIVWAIAFAKGRYLKEFKELLARRLPKNITPEELITHLSSEPLKIAKIYNEQGDYKTAGFWAAISFEKFLREECMRLMNFIPPRENGEMSTLINHLCKTNEYRPRRKILHTTRLLRNKAVHESETFTQSEVNDFIRNISRLRDAR